MLDNRHFPIVDLFAGPGGLGEGFSSHDLFRILVSAEMDPSAHATLRLRAFYRILKRKNSAGLAAYYDFCNYGTPFPKSLALDRAWLEASHEAQQLTLGKAEDNLKLDQLIQAGGVSPDKTWVLIGGPPCQAYSLVGRARNRGKVDYKPEEDHRHFLYKEYLRIIQKYRPAIFVMENVKGILSSSVNGERIFNTILQDLVDPDRALGQPQSAVGYRIYSLSHPVSFDRSTDPSTVDPKKFIVKAENYGIPQARHRVILLGVREDIDVREIRPLVPAPSFIAVRDALLGLPARRSHLSRKADIADEWLTVVAKHFSDLEKAARKRKLNDLSDAFLMHSKRLNGDLSTGELRSSKVNNTSRMDPLSIWYNDPALKVWLNHEVRGHMPSDLLRYAYAAVYAEVNGRSPTGHTEFDLLEQLRPAHANWESGKFSDRFRVQRANSPSTTITSHISKDGHYFIHPDPAQCRSLSVREAARLQTFPDNYFFQGNRTQQFHQVGNAVPPLLARKIAEIVLSILANQNPVQMKRHAA